MYIHSVIKLRQEIAQKIRSIIMGLTPGTLLQIVHEEVSDFRYMVSGD